MSQDLTAKGRSPSLLGGAMIIAGTTVGAGMFTLPVMTSGMWFFYSLLILALTWLLMYSSSLLILEANLNYPIGASFDTMTEDLLGHGGRIITGALVAFVLYILTYAYISGGGSTTALTLGNLLGIPVLYQVGGLLFGGVLALIVYLSTKAVDRITTIMLGAMVITFFMSVAGLIYNIKLPVLLNNSDPTAHYAPYILIAIPVCLASFGYHGNIPSLMKYYGKAPKKIACAALLGSLMALFFYFLWQLSALGNLPRDTFRGIMAAGGNMDVLLAALGQTVKQSHLNILLQIFANLAVASSFLGVTLGLFDYIADLFKFDDSHLGRLKTAVITFAPPLIGAMIWPNGFLLAIGFAALAAAGWAVIIPVLLAIKSRRKFGNPQFRTPGGRLTLVIVFGYGVLVILCHLLGLFGLLPQFGA
ncbi:tryptophan permease [Dongshaea marina]|uniref:tryptophan permease n=1 Tax=Dongshaea marina TaxID=2047966 RepID=UPI000D3E4B8C|nr:tryptophan permease [Dongshaea marina]